MNKESYEQLITNKEKLNQFLLEDIEQIKIYYKL
jgi:hypothetical protein